MIILNILQLSTWKIYEDENQIDEFKYLSFVQHTFEVLDPKTLNILRGFLKQVFILQ